MNDLISRAAAIAEIEEYIEEYSELEPETGYHNLKWCAMEEARDVLSMLPAVDAVPVVRCKDCKYRIVNKNYSKRGYMKLKAVCDLDTGDYFQLGRNAKDDDWFCADGERRDEDAAD